MAREPWLCRPTARKAAPSPRPSYALLPTTTLDRPSTHIALYRSPSSLMDTHTHIHTQACTHSHIHTFTHTHAWMPHAPRRCLALFGAGLSTQLKYCFAWTLAESGFTLAGLSFEGWDPSSGRALW